MKLRKKVIVGIGGTEIMAYNEALKRDLVTNGAVSGIDILSFDSLKSGEFTKVRSKKQVFLSEFGIENVADITSIASDKRFSGGFCRQQSQNRSELYRLFIQRGGVQNECASRFVAGYGDFYAGWNEGRRCE